MDPRVAVLITYFNEGALLTECLESLRAQEEAPDEVIVCDDASTLPADRYLPAGYPVRVIRSETNRGPSHARNELLRASTADYVHFHDSDDLFHPAWCRRVRQVIRETGADAVFTEMSSAAGGKLISEGGLGLDRLTRGEDPVRFCIRGGVLPSSGTYRRQAVLAIGGYREQIWQSEDFDFHIRLTASGVRCAVIPESLVQKRIHPASRSTRREEVWESALKAIDLLSLEIPSRYRVDLANAAVRAGAELFRMGERDRAREAFRTAARIGPPDFQGQRPLYRAVAAIFGPESAEHLGAFYRKVVPERSRRFVQKRRLW